MNLRFFYSMVIFYSPNVCIIATCYTLGDTVQYVLGAIDTTVLYTVANRYDTFRPPTPWHTCMEARIRL